MTDKAKTLLEKTGGDAAYRRKSYDAAISHYTNAMRLDPTEMTYDYQGCNSIEIFLSQNLSQNLFQVMFEVFRNS